MPLLNVQFILNHSNLSGFHPLMAEKWFKRGQGWDLPYIFLHGPAGSRREVGANFDLTRR